MAGCASIDRSGEDGGVPPTVDTDPPLPPRPPYNPDASLPTPPTPPDAAPPECTCDDDCDQGEKCSEQKCYKSCACDDDCSGPDNNSCDNGLCKGHE